MNLETFTRFSSILAYLSGARRRVGYYRFSQEGLYCGQLLSHRVPHSVHQHTWKSYVTLVDALREAPGDQPSGRFRIPDSARRLPRFCSTESDRARIHALLKQQAPGWSHGGRLILVNPNASQLVPLRKWPLDRYIELVRRLLEDPSVYVGITGVATEREEAQLIVRTVGSRRVIDLTGRTDLADLLHLFNMAELLVTNDSGPAHFASLTEIPILVFFGPETPELYKPLSENCTVMYSHFACSPCDDNRCLKAISVDEVHAAIQSVALRRQLGDTA